MDSSRDKKEALALLLTRRQKRLLDWQKQFAGERISEDLAAKLGDLYSTYALLLSKIAGAQDEGEVNDCELRLQSIERRLSSLFESRRRMTSDIGLAAVKD